MKILFISLGCDKNLVDSEEMLGLLNSRGYTFTDDETEADVIIINIVEDLATITDEDERKAKLTERVKGMKKLFDAEVAKEVTKAKAEFLKGTTPTTGTSTKNTEKDTYNKAKKAGDVKGMLDAKFYATEETD